MAKFNASKAAQKINRMGLKGVSAKTTSLKKFSEKDKAAIKKARQQLKSK